MKLFGFLEFGFVDLAEIALITFILVYLYKWTRGSYAIQATVGILLIIVINAVVSIIGFSTINFIISRILDFGVLALLIIFQPEIRKLLYAVGGNTKLDRLFETGGSNPVLDEVIEAVKIMSKERIGALIVFAGNSNLQDVITDGVKINADVTKDLLLTIFNKNTPLHDGAVIVRNNRIDSASVYLTISQNQNISQVFGTRHRAALGVTESSNVLVVVVSEESGRISTARNGSLNSGMTIQQLRTELQNHFGKTQDDSGNGVLSARSQMELRFQ